MRETLQVELLQDHRNLGLAVWVEHPGYSVRIRRFSSSVLMSLPPGSSHNRRIFAIQLRAKRLHVVFLGTVVGTELHDLVQA